MVCTSLHLHFRTLGPLGLCSEMPFISPFLHVKVLIDLQGPQEAPSLTKPLEVEDEWPVFSRLPCVPGVFLPRILGVPPGDLVKCLLVSASQQALRDQELYFIHLNVLPGPRRQVPAFHADRSTLQDSRYRAEFDGGDRCSA